MMQTMLGVVRDGKVQLAEAARLPEGANVLVTLLPAGEDEFWARAAEKSLAAIWDNAEDDASSCRTGRLGAGEFVPASNLHGAAPRFPGCR